MTADRTRLTAVLLAALAILAVAAGGVAADSFDTGTGDATTTTSDVSGTSTTVELRPGNASASLYVEINTSSTTADGNRSLLLKPEDSDGEVLNYTAYENDTPDNVSAAAGGPHLAWNITHDELEDLPRDVGGGTYRLEIWNTSSDEEILNTTVVFDHKADNDSDKVAVIHLANTTSAKTFMLGDRLEISETFGLWGVAEFWKDNGTTVSAWSGYTTVNGTNTSVEVHMVDDEAAESYSDAAEDLDDGDWLKSSTLWVNGVPAKVYVNEAPEDPPEDRPYGIWHDDSETLEVVHQGDAFDDVRNLQVRGTGGDGFDFGTLVSEFGFLDAVSSTLPSMSSLGL